MQALERFALGIHQATEHGHGLHHTDLAILHAPLVQVVARARRLDRGRGCMVAFEVEAHRAALVGGDRDEVAAGAQGRAAAAQVVGAQGDVIDVGLHVHDQAGTGAVVLAGEHHLLLAQGEGAVQVEAAGQLVVERRALGIAVTTDKLVFETGHAGQTDAVGVGGCRGGHALQHVVLQVLAVGQRGIVVAGPVAGSPRADTGGPLLARRAEGQADAQVDPAVAPVARAGAGGPVEH